MARPRDMKAKASPVTKVITIHVDEKTRDVTVTPTSVNVTQGTTLRWEADQAESFVLTFDDARLCQGGHEIVGTSKGATTTVTGRLGIFHYHIALSVNGTAYVLSGCPSVHNKP
jgi:plastocyanin